MLDQPTEDQSEREQDLKSEILSLKSDMAFKDETIADLEQKIEALKN